VASPVRLFNDASNSNTPPLALSIPEEEFQRGNSGDYEDVISGLQGDATSSANNPKASSGSHSDGVGLSGVHMTGGARQQGDSDELPHAQEGNRGPQEQAQLLAAAVLKAKEVAEREAAEIIALAKTEIERAKETARQQMELESAVQKATLQVKLDTEVKLNRLQHEADAERKQTETDNITTNKEREAAAALPLHEGDFYWDENDNIAGGNDLSGEKKKLQKKEQEPGREGGKGSGAKDSSTPEDDSPPPARQDQSPSKPERKSNIPKLKTTSPLDPPLISSPLEKEKKEEVSPGLEGEESLLAKVSSKEKQKAEARARIRQAKKDFKRRQAKEEEAGGTLMTFIPVDRPELELELQPTGGDELLPPTGGDELLPGGSDEDDESLASTTVGEDELPLLSPRRRYSFPGQGSRPDTVRALREISQQRKHMDRALAELQRWANSLADLLTDSLADLLTDSLADCLTHSADSLAD
jgi:hypothetical protein